VTINGRIPPLGQPKDYKTYSLLAPLGTHWREATCAEADCAVSRQGWIVQCDEASNLGATQAAYIRSRSGRHYTEGRNGPLTVFRFPPGENCFTAHRVKLEREPIYLRRHGDWRGYQDPVRHTAEGWVEDFAEHQDRLERKLNG
jgi:hypothetical protein